MLEVLEPGLSSTIQDEGRPGLAHLGIRRSGAADRRALAACNLLVGEPVGAPVLEMTLLGATLAVRQDCLIGLAGADMEVRVVEEGRGLTPRASYRLAAGTTIACGGAIDGARAYLALAGGIMAERVLGAASTDLWARVGGRDGRALRAGDVLTAGSEPLSGVGERRWPTLVASSGVSALDGPRRVAVTDGPHADRFHASTLQTLFTGTWRVSARSDRVGIRLEGPSLVRAGPDAAAGELVSMPMVPGAIQVPPDGRPIILHVDAPTVGGYPVPAVAIDADMPVLAQLRPGDEVRFERIGPDEARARAAAAAAELDAVARQLATHG